MDIDQMKSKWKAIAVPAYSPEELESIFAIKRNHLLTAIRSWLRADLLVAEGIVLAFIVLLQYLDLQTSNFWSFFMFFIGVQHLVIYSLQSFIIERQCHYAGNVMESIDDSIRKLRIVLWHYRTWPALLCGGLLALYLLRFDPFQSTTINLLMGLALVLAILIISEFLSSALVKAKIRQLQELQQEFNSLK